MNCKIFALASTFVFAASFAFGSVAMAESLNAQAISMVGTLHPLAMAAMVGRKLDKGA